MQYSYLQQLIAGRLDNRTDLGSVIYDYSQGRIRYWSSFFFYESDVVDTSLVTTPGQIFYQLPNGIKYLRHLRLMIGNNLQTPPNASTTTTAQVILPAATIPVVSTANFSTTNAMISVAGAQVYYGSVDSTDFKNCVGVAPNVVNSTFASGTTVIQLAGIWIDMNKVSYDQLISIDVLSPPLQTLPSDYAQINTQFRLYPTPSASFPLECTGNAAPPAPVNDADDNFWTEDAAWLIIASTANEIRKGYLHEEQSAIDAGLEAREVHRLRKVSGDLMDSMQLRFNI